MVEEHDAALESSFSHQRAIAGFHVIAFGALWGPGSLIEFTSHTLPAHEGGAGGGISTPVGLSETPTVGFEPMRLRESSA